MAALPPRNPGLLVSVRSAEEAAAALRGGADLIDVKEPRRGSLGRADDATIAAVVARVAGRRPVSAALGELAEPDACGLPLSAPGLAFVKWGLAGAAAGDWLKQLGQRAAEVAAVAPGCGVVAVAYADWQEVGAPPVAEVLAFARRRQGGVLLLDTCRKAPRRMLLDYLRVVELARLRQACAESGVLLALAGSLGPAEIAALLPVRPDWFAVRGAACVAGERGGVVAEERVRGLAALLAGKPNTPESAVIADPGV
jgi:uncharacterized protein (UPF0264 family)